MTDKDYRVWTERAQRIRTGPTLTKIRYEGIDTEATAAIDIPGVIIADRIIAVYDDGTEVESTDDGVTWADRSAPKDTDVQN